MRVGQCYFELCAVIEGAEMLSSQSLPSNILLFNHEDIHIDERIDERSVKG